LSQPPDSFDVLFNGSDQVLPLHVELAKRGAHVNMDNPLQTAIHAEKYNLGITLQRQTGGAPKVIDLRLHPKDGSFAIVTHAVQSTIGESVRWQTTPQQGSLPLAIRLGDVSRPGTLLLAGADSAQGTLKPINIIDNHIHGEVRDAQFTHSDGAALTCTRVLPHPANDSSGQPFDQYSQLALRLQAEATAPTVVWTANDTAKLKFELKRPGASYRASEGSADNSVQRYKFSGQQTALPLVPKTHLAAAAEAAGGAAWLHDVQADLDKSFSTHNAPIADAVVHETHRSESAVEGSPQLTLASVFANDALTLGAHQIEHSYHLFNVEKPSIKDPIPISRPIGANPDYIVIRAGEPLPGQDAILGDLPPLKFTLAENAQEISFDDGGSHAKGDGTLPRAILKFSRFIKLSDIAVKEGFSDDFTKKIVPLITDQRMLQPQWIGIIFFNVDANIVDDLLKHLIPPAVQSSLSFQYVAATPTRPTSAAASTYSISACLSWANLSDDTPAPTDDHSNELTYRLDSIDGAWEDTNLQYLNVKTTLKFSSFLGLGNQEPIEIEVDGYFDHATNTLRFTARVLDQLR
jgi:hypothetical protein